MRRSVSVLGIATAATLLCLSGCAVSPAPANFVGTWGTEAQGQPSLTIENDNTYSGTDGCNRLFGTYEIEGASIVFEPPASTMMFCEGVDTWLLNMASGRIDGDSLEIQNAKQMIIGSLTRASS